MRASLVIVGLALDETLPIPPLARVAIEQAKFIIAECRSVFGQQLKRANISIHGKDVYFLDNVSETEWKRLQNSLREARGTNVSVVLLSDIGMPILFDPGKDVLQICRTLGYEILTVPGPTSWSTACVISGYSPPFLLEGFLPRKTEERIERLKELAKAKAHCIFMDTPYRFRSLFDQLTNVFDPSREAFLAWEIGKGGQRYLWGSLKELRAQIQMNSLIKGEFVLITKLEK